MGAFGTGLFSNDVAPEAKEVYIDSLKVGKTDKEAYAKVMEECKDYLEDEEDKVDLWLGFASFLFDYGRLDNVTRETALSLIGVDADLSRWDKKDLKKRMKVLEELRVKLNSEMPERKKVSLAKKKTPKVKPNEIYYLRLDDERYRDKPYHNLYVLILIDSWEEYDLKYGLGDEYPLAYFKICKDVPSELAEIDNLPFFDWHFDIFRDKIINQEKRAIVIDDGYNQIKKRLKYIGSYEFKRDENVLGKYCQNIGYRDIRVPYRNTGKLIWDGYYKLWSTIERDIVYFFDHCPGADTLIK
ncbi:MAG: hypothetical protein MJ172_10060 [Clostridia bacterium]|nr:hypothetical protein [Clostridia bacterium]